jgi:hypothetical protein
MNARGDQSQTLSSVPTSAEYTWTALVGVHADLASIANGMELAPPSIIWWNSTLDESTFRSLPTTPMVRQSGSRCCPSPTRQRAICSRQNPAYLPRCAAAPGLGVDLCQPIAPFAYGRAYGAGVRSHPTVATIAGELTGGWAARPSRMQCGFELCLSATCIVTSRVCNADPDGPRIDSAARPTWRCSVEYRPHLSNRAKRQY